MKGSLEDKSSSLEEKYRKKRGKEAEKTNIISNKTTSLEENTVLSLSRKEHK
jgi:hypothetical protein